MANRGKRRLVLTAIVALSLIATACSGNQKAEPAASSTASSAPASIAPSNPTAVKELKIRFYDDPAGFDPAKVFRVENETITFNIFSGLMTYDSQTGELVSDLAESWESEGNLTWTFKLRQGVQWQQGFGEFTSEDVLYTHQRNIDPATASPYATELSNIKSVTAPDAYTVVYELNKPDGNFLHVVANYHQGQIVKKEAVEKYGDQFQWNPVGTGPYAFDSMKTNSQIVLVRHDEYYQGPAPISKLIFSIIKDEDTATIALQNGEVDLAMRINRDEALVRLEKAGFTMNNRQNRSIQLRIFNTEVKPFDDVRVRQAWAHAVDFNAISEAIAPYLQSGAHSMLPEWMEVYTDDVPMYEFNPEKAKQLLAEAGYPDGFTVEQGLVSSGGVKEENQLEQEYLKEVGINLEFVLVDSPVFNEQRNKGDYAMSSRALPAINPDMILFSYYHPDNFTPGGLNGAKYNNPLLTEKLEAARAEVDADKRLQLYKEVQQIALTDLPYLPTSSLHGYWPGFDYVKNVYINPLSQVNFYEVDIVK